MNSVRGPQRSVLPLLGSYEYSLLYCRRVDGETSVRPLLWRIYRPILHECRLSMPRDKITGDSSIYHLQKKWGRVGRASRPTRLSLHRK